MTIDKKIFITEIIATVYFVLMFTGVIAGLNYVLVGAIVEFITIPLMLLQVFILGLVGYTLLKKDKKINYRLALSGLLSAGLVICFFVLQ